MFNAASYSAIRPTYPRALYDFIYHYHGQSPGARWLRVVDLGCGTGQATVEFTAFQEAIGVDPSESMLKKANETLSRSPSSNTIKYIKSQAESLDFLEAESVDLIVAGIIKLIFCIYSVWL